MTRLNVHHVVGVVALALIAVALIAVSVSAVNAQESDDAPPAVSARQSDNETSTPVTIDPPDSGDPGSEDGATGQAVDVPNRPARPTRLRDTDITTTSIRIRWTTPGDNGSAITGYTVRYQDRDGGGVGVAGPWTEVSASASSTSKVISGLTSATRYNFEIKATNGEGDSAWSPNRYGHTKPGRVSTPTLTAGNGSLGASWSAPSGGTEISSYKVRYKLTSATSWSSGGSSTTTQKTISGLTNGSSYHVQVRACNRILFETVGAGDSCGAWSSSATGTPGTTTPPGPDPIRPQPSPTPVPPTVTISADDSSVTEGTGIGFTVSASRAPSSNLTVSVSVTESGSFISGTRPSSVTILAGQSEASFTVNTEDDSFDEANGSVTGTISGGIGYSVGRPPSAVVTVLDNDDPPLPPSRVLSFSYEKPDIVIGLSRDLSPDDIRLPAAQNASGTVEYDISTLPSGITFYNRGSTRALQGYPTEVVDALEVTYTATDTGTTPHTFIRQRFNFTVTDIPDPDELSIDLRIREVDGETRADDDRIGTNLSGTVYLAVLGTLRLEVVDPYRDPLDPEMPLRGDPPVEDFRSYEFRFRVEEDTGMDIDANNDHSCNYPSEAGRDEIDWVWALSFRPFQMSRCRLGDGTSTIKLDVRVRGVPTRQALGHITVTPVMAPHHADNVATYRMCGAMPYSPDIDWIAQTDAAADEWEAQWEGDVETTHPMFVDQGTDVTFGNCILDVYQSGYTNIRAGRGDVFEAFCGEGSFACVRSGPLSGNMHYGGQTLIFRDSLVDDNRWVATKAEAVDDDHVWFQGVMTHEFGHVGGLGHTNVTALMQGGYSSMRVEIDDYDKTAMEAIYDDHAAH